jgi:hypothetical protein
MARTRRGETAVAEFWDFSSHRHTISESLTATPGKLCKCEGGKTVTASRKTKAARHRCACDSGATSLVSALFAANRPAAIGLIVRVAAAVSSTQFFRARENPGQFAW